MNSKTVKLIRQYAKLRGLDSHRCKQTYEKSTLEERAIFKAEMVAALADPKPGLLRVRR